MRYGKKLFKVDINCYGGYKGEERPVSFIIAGREYRLVDIISRWYEPGLSCFKVKTEDQHHYMLILDQISGTWSATPLRLFDFGIDDQDQ